MMRHVLSVLARHVDLRRWRPHRLGLAVPVGLALLASAPTTAGASSSVTGLMAGGMSSPVHTSVQYCGPNMPTADSCKPVPSKEKPPQRGQTDGPDSVKFTCDCGYIGYARVNWNGSEPKDHYTGDIRADHEEWIPGIASNADIVVDIHIRNQSLDTWVTKSFNTGPGLRTYCYRLKGTINLLASPNDQVKNAWVDEGC
jgi:hypothetical protein